MRGETAFEAFDTFARPIRAALRCVTQARLGPRFEPLPGRFQTLAFDNVDASVPLRRQGLRPIHLRIVIHFRLMEHTEAVDRASRFQIQPIDYFYSISDHRNSEILSYHWHPEALHGARPEPHLHVKIKTAHPTDPSLDDVFPRLHLPTGQVTVDAIFRLLIEQFGVVPLNPGWDATLGS